jgi:hypothetical protein
MVKYSFFRLVLNKGGFDFIAPRGGTAAQARARATGFSNLRPTSFFIK